jgi:hypothetical protein
MLGHVDCFCVFIRLFFCAAGKVSLSIATSEHAGNRVVFNPHSDVLAVASNDNTIKLYAVQTGNKLLEVGFVTDRTDVCFVVFLAHLSNTFLWLSRYSTVGWTHGCRAVCCILQQWRHTHLSLLRRDRAFLGLALLVSIYFLLSFVFRVFVASGNGPNKASQQRN